jgi:UDP-N-acetylglucosamine 4-epimerase
MKDRKNWLVTGCAGFIGSHLCEYLLQNDQRVVGVDSFATGHQHNVDSFLSPLNSKQRMSFQFHEYDLRDSSRCAELLEGIDIVLHQAAIGSVPRSIEKPGFSNDNNVSAFVNLVEGARKANVKRIVYASSSSVYGSEPTLPKKEDVIGKPLSPYAATKLFDEIYADVFSYHYGIEFIGLRYFNVFGPRQDPNGPYAAVIPRWLAALVDGRSTDIYGDGTTSRDFCYIKNVVQANMLAATVENKAALNQVYNIAFGEKTSLAELLELIKASMGEKNLLQHDPGIRWHDFRPGDIKHSLANIEKAKGLLGYAPKYSVHEGIEETIAYWAEIENKQAAVVGL